MSQALRNMEPAESVAGQLLQQFAIEHTEESLELSLMNEEQVNCPVFHHFGPGIYMREVFLPADTVALGHKHRFAHLNILLKGRISIVKDDGSIAEHTAPMILTTPAGRKLAYVHEDTVWINVYPEESRDIEDIENRLLDKSDASIDHYRMKKPLANMADIEDYAKFLKEYDLDPKVVTQVSENEEDQIPFPDGTWAVMISDSSLHGKGLFSTGNFKSGDLICPATVGAMRTPAGRFTNHSISPNAEPVIIGDDIWFRATEDITGNLGGSIGDEITINYRRGLEVKRAEVSQ